MSKGNHILQKSRTTGLEGRHGVEKQRETTETCPHQPYSRAFRELLMVEDITILHNDTQIVLHSSFIPICLTVSIKRKKMLSTSTHTIRKEDISLSTTYPFPVHSQNAHSLQWQRRERILHISFHHIVQTICSSPPRTRSRPTRVIYLHH